MKLAQIPPFAVCLLAGMIFPAGDLAAAEPAPAGVAASPEKTAEPEIKQPRVYSGKVSGDNAFMNQDFVSAASFYRIYRQEAEQNGDTPAIREAFECELNALILVADVVQAEKLLKEYSRIADKSSAISIELWKAELLLLRGKPAAAEKALKKILEKMPRQAPGRVRAAFILGVACDKQKKYDQAAKIYEELTKQGGHSDFDRHIAQRLILSLAAAEKMEEAVERLTVLQQTTETTEHNIEAHSLLNIYLILKNSAAESTELVFDKTNTVKTTDDFFFLITSLIGDEFFKKKAYQSALNAYKLAYLYAKTTSESFDALTRMTVMFDKMQKKEDAAALALTQLELFKHSNTSNKLKKFAARLFFDTGHNAEALVLYEQIFTADPAEKCDGIISYLIRKKMFEQAKNIVQLYHKKDLSAPEALLLFATIAEAEKDQAAAADFYVQAYKKTVAKGDPKPGHRALQLYSDLQKYPEILKLAGEIITTIHQKTGKGDAIAYFFRGQANEALGDLEAARQDFLACEKNGTYLPEQALFNASAISYRQNQFNIAKQGFLKIFQTQKYEKLAPEAAFWLILCAYNLEDSVYAEKITFQLDNRFPESDYAAQALLLLADFYEKSKLPQRAETQLKKIAERKSFPILQARALHRQALMAYKRKDYQTAERLLIEIRTNFASVAPMAENYFLMGDIYRAQSKFDEAEEAYRNAASLRPDSRLAQAAAGSQGDCIFAIATANDDQAGLERAQLIYEKLLTVPDLLPEYRIMTHYKVGRCLQLRGNIHEAFAQYRKLISGLSRADAAANPILLFWAEKAVNTMELLALKNSNTEMIHDTILAMKALVRIPELAKKANFTTRIQRLENHKRKIINTGESEK